MKKEYCRKIVVHRSGNLVNPNISLRLTIPSAVARDMGINEYTPSVILTYDNETKTFSVKKAEA